MPTSSDLSGRYTLRIDDSYREVAREDVIDESAFSEFVPDFRGICFEEVHGELAARFPSGRMRVLCKDMLTCDSWHRDPESRLHGPDFTHLDSLFTVHHHCTHLPADGSGCFTDTRCHHTALNGGENQRLHIVAALGRKQSERNHSDCFQERQPPVQVALFQFHGDSMKLKNALAYPLNED